MSNDDAYWTECTWWELAWIMLMFLGVLIWEFITIPVDILREYLAARALKRKYKG